MRRKRREIFGEGKNDFFLMRRKNRKHFGEEKYFGGGEIKGRRKEKEEIYI